MTKLSDHPSVTRSQASTRLLTGAASGLQLALGAVDDPRFLHYDQSVKEVWVTGCLIHNDLIRLLVAYQESEPGVMRLLWAGDMLSAWLEARDWLNKYGSPLLRSIATDKAEVSRALKELAQTHPTGNIERFRKYRHKVGHHYSTETSELIKQLGQEDSEQFYLLITRAAQYMSGWILLLKSAIGEMHSLRPPKADNT